MYVLCTGYDDDNNNDMGNERCNGKTLAQTISGYTSTQL